MYARYSAILERPTLVLSCRPLLWIVAALRRLRVPIQLCALAAAQTPVLKTSYRIAAPRMNAPINLAPDPAKPAQIVDHQVDIMVVVAGDDRRGPVGSTQNKPPDTNRDSNGAGVIRSEAVILGVDGNSDFEAMYSGKYNEEVRLYAFDMLAGDGDDMRKLPLSMRKTNLVSKHRDRAYRHPAGRRTGSR